MTASIEITAHTLERPGCTIHYWLSGSPDRPLVALTHGATMDHRMFDEQVRALTPDYRVLTWDVRGHGASQPMTGAFSLELCAEDLIAILDVVGAEKVVLGGQSMGGMIAQHVYFRQPERVMAMLMIDTTSIALPYKKWEVLTLKATMPLVNLWPYRHFTETVARGVSIKPQVQQYALEAINQMTKENFLTIWKAVTLAVDEQGLPGHHIRVPLLLVHGDHDTLGSIRKQAPTWAASEPDVRYQVIPDAGHNANQDNPAFFNQLLLTFLREKLSA